MDGEDRRRRRRSSPGWGGAATAARSSVDVVEWTGRGVVERRRLAREATGWGRQESGGGERAPRGKGVARVEMSRVRGLPNGVGVLARVEFDVGS
jgi:hypothetical protein